MRTIVVAVLCLFYYSIDAQNITLEDIWTTYKFYPASIEDIRSMANGEYYTINENNSTIAQYAYKNGKFIKNLFSINDIRSNNKPNKIDEYWLSADESKILIASYKKRIYRHSSNNKYFVYDIKTKELICVKDEPVQEASLSPDGKKIAYVFNNNLYYKNIDNSEEIAITNDGERNKIINGIPDWVYEEEFSFSKAYEWSNDGKYLAYLKFNESQVKEFSFPIYNGLYPEEYRYKYPKAGERNSSVSIHIYQFETKKTLNITLDADTDFYIPRIYWTSLPNTLIALKLNRLQNTLQLYMIDASNGNKQCIYTEKSDTYLELPDILFTKDGKSFFITSDKDGYNHIYLYSINGNLIKQITSGQWDVTKINAYHDNKQVLYYTSAEQSPLKRNVYAININTLEKKCITPADGTNDATINSTCTYFINEYSNANTPPIYTLCDINGKVIRTLEDNKALVDKLNEAHYSKKEFFTITTSENIILNASMIKPKNFDANKKYPVMFCIYGGPGSQEVLDKWDYSNLWYQHLASKDIIVITVDNRGTGARGRDFRKCTYKNLGKYETIDQIEAAKALSKYDYIDNHRIGIWGWSFGGYAFLLYALKKVLTFLNLLLQLHLLPTGVIMIQFIQNVIMDFLKIILKATMIIRQLIILKKSKVNIFLFTEQLTTTYISKIL